MKTNYNTTITGERCILVPYRREHVALYHTWMQDPVTLTLTASEPLTLEQEYEVSVRGSSDTVEEGRGLLVKGAACQLVGRCNVERCAEARVGCRPVQMVCSRAACIVCADAAGLGC